MTSVRPHPHPRDAGTTETWIRARVPVGCATTAAPASTENTRVRRESVRTIFVGVRESTSPTAAEPCKTTVRVAISRTRAATAAAEDPRVVTGVVPCSIDRGVGQQEGLDAAPSAAIAALGDGARSARHGCPAAPTSRAGDPDSALVQVSRC